MGIIGILLAALIVGFLLMSNVSSPPSEEPGKETASDGNRSQLMEQADPRSTIDSVQHQADSLLKSSEDKYRELDR